jgi:Vam6/Vps39-like protein vacuolar protein sorting-associated protein 39
MIAQVVETALFRSYLLFRPSLLGALCRIENWCEVEEVEGMLLEAKVSKPVTIRIKKSLESMRQKYSELLDLYKGKNKHEKAIELLKRCAT